MLGRKEKMKQKNEWPAATNLHVKLVLFVTNLVEINEKVSEKKMGFD